MYSCHPLFNECLTLLSEKDTRSHLKIRILVQGQGEPEFQPAGILKYVEDLKRGVNTEIEPKNHFEIASMDITASTASNAVPHS